MHGLHSERPRPTDGPVGADKGVRMRRFRRTGMAMIGAAAVVAAGLVAQRANAAPAPAKDKWLQCGYNESKSADDTAESTINLGNVAGLKQLFKVPLTDTPDGSPVYLSNVTTAKGVQDLVFLQGEHGPL